MELILRSGLIRGWDSKYVSSYSAAPGALQAELSSGNLHLNSHGQSLTCSLDAVRKLLQPCWQRTPQGQPEAPWLVRRQLEDSRC